MRAVMLAMLVLAVLRLRPLTLLAAVAIWVRRDGLGATAAPAVDREEEEEEERRTVEVCLVVGLAVVTRSGEVRRTPSMAALRAAPKLALVE